MEEGREKQIREGQGRGEGGERDTQRRLWKSVLDGVVCNSKGLKTTPVSETGSDPQGEIAPSVRCQLKRSQYFHTRKLYGPLKRMSGLKKKKNPAAQFRHYCLTDPQDMIYTYTHIRILYV